MIVLSVICLVAGVAAVAASLRVPERRATLEAVGGGLFVAGLIAIGLCLPLFR